MGTVFNRRLINENKKADRDLATRVTALEQGGGGGGSTTLTATQIGIASHGTSTAATQPEAVSGSVTVIHDGTSWVASHISVIGTPMMADYKEFFSGMEFTLDTTDLDIPDGIITGEAQILDTMMATSLGFVPYIIEILSYEGAITTARLIIGTIGTIASGNATSLRA